MDRPRVPRPVLLAVAALCLLACVGGVGFKLLQGGAGAQRAAANAQRDALAAIEADVAPAPAATVGGGQVEGTSARTASVSTCTVRLRRLVSALEAAGRQARIGLVPELAEANAARASLDSGSLKCPPEATRPALAALAAYAEAATVPESDRDAAWDRAAAKVADARRQLTARR